MFFHQLLSDQLLFLALNSAIFSVSMLCRFGILIIINLKRFCIQATKIQL